MAEFWTYLKAEPMVLAVELGEREGKSKIILRFRAKATKIEIRKS